MAERDFCESCSHGIADDEMRKYIEGTDYEGGEFGLTFCMDCWTHADLSEWGVDQDDLDSML